MLQAKVKRAIATLGSLLVLVSILLFAFYNPVQAAPVTQVFSVSSGASDVAESGTSYSENQSAIRVGSCGNAAGCTTGLRFENVQIPQGATIQEARLEMRSPINSWITLSLIISGDSQVDSQVFSSSSRPSDRQRTVSQISHVSNTSWTANNWYTLHDIAPILQEQVNKSAWQTGNTFSAIIEPTNPSGWGAKFMYAYENSPANAARLVVTYETSSQPTPTPTSSPTPTPTATPSPTVSPTPTSTPTPTPTSTPTPTPQVLGIGVLGASGEDEYQGTDNRGGEYHDTTFNWVEMIAIKNPEADFGEWGSYAEPRRTGYAYNWARSGATTQSLLSQGQHTGVAQQVTSGEIGTVLLSIGANDFFAAADGIMNGSTSQAEIDELISDMLANVNTAINTIEGAGDVNVFIKGLNTNDDFYTIGIPDPAARDRIIAAMTQYNQGLENIAQTGSHVYWDQTEFYDEMFSDLVDNTYHEVGGELINVIDRGNEPHHLLLDDAFVHVGTVSSGVRANFVLDILINTFGYDFDTFTEAEMIATAGIVPTTPTPTPTSTPTPTPTPTPTSTPSPTPTVTPTPSTGPQQIVVQVAASADDVQESGNNFFSNPTTMRVGGCGNATRCTVGLRFQNVQVPQGATIAEARLEMRASSTNWITMDLVIKGDDAGNSAAFSPSNRPSGRTGTTAQVIHSSNTQWLTNTWYTLDNVTNILQELVNRPDWQSGSAASIIIDPTNPAGWGAKFVHAFDGSPLSSPRLVIEYQ